ncbi:MAG: undecaprenyldiphospho-muramoylpentapeptide beta-N-acetylglucosaminyltransferase [bacterium]
MARHAVENSARVPGRRDSWPKKGTEGQPEQASNIEPLRVVFAGGGTGGHLYPAVALAQEFTRKRPAEILFIGTSYGIENKVMPKLPYKFKTIWMRGLHRREILSNLLFPVRLLVSLLQCSAIFRAFRPQVVIGTGGYVSGPALMMAVLLGIPTVIQEQNSYPGLVNRLLGKRVRQVHVTFEDSKRYFQGQPNIFVSGNPVRADLTGRESKMARSKFHLSDGKTTLFIFGGSQGAHAINQTVLESLARLLEIKELQILWATGPGDWDEVSTRCRELGERISCHAYLDDMASAYAAADFVLCRSGASALAEIALCGLPAILVPLPTAAAGHQEFNARSVEKAGAGVVILQQHLTAEVLVRTVTDFVRHAKKRRVLSQAASKLARPQAAREIIERILSIV